MGKIKFGGNEKNYEEEFDGDFEYKGPTPQGKGPWRGVVKRLELRKTSPTAKTLPNCPQLVILIELKAAKGDKANEKFNGYGLWERINVTDQSAKFVNAFLDALTDGSEEATRKLRKAFWTGGLVVDGDEVGHVERIGSKNIGSPDDCDIPIYFVGKNGKYQDEPRLEVRRYLTLESAQEYDGFGGGSSESSVDPSELEDLPEDDDDDSGNEETIATESDDDEGFTDDEPPF